MALECDEPGPGERRCGQVLGDSGQVWPFILHPSSSCLVSRKERKKKRKQLSKCPFLSDPGAVSPQLCWPRKNHDRQHESVAHTTAASLCLPAHIYSPVSSRQAGQLQGSRVLLTPLLLSSLATTLTPMLPAWPPDPAGPAQSTRVINHTCSRLQRELHFSTQL